LHSSIDRSVFQAQQLRAGTLTRATPIICGRNIAASEDPSQSIDRLKCITNPSTHPLGLWLFLMPGLPSRRCLSFATKLKSSPSSIRPFQGAARIITGWHFVNSLDFSAESDFNAGDRERLKGVPDRGWSSTRGRAGSGLLLPLDRINLRGRVVSD
jgi:hypothetical protein